MKRALRPGNRVHSFVARLFVLVVVLWCGGAARSSGWSEIHLPHFTLVTNCKPKTAIELGKRFEQNRSVLRLSHLGPKVDPGQDVVVYIVEKRRDIKRLEPDLPSTVAGFFRPSPWRVHIVIDASSPTDPMATVAHEYNHLVLKMNHPNTPAWLTEGLAEFWGQTQFKKDKVTIGRLTDLQIAPLQRSQGHWQTTEELIEVEDPHHKSHERVSMFYAQSFLLVHYLSLGDPTTGDRVAALLEALDGGADPRNALEAQVGDLKKLDTMLYGYATQKRFLSLSQPAMFDPGKIEATVRPLSKAEVEMYQADALLAGGHVKEAEKRLDKAHKLQPEGSARYLELAGLCARQRRDTAQAAKLFAEAAEREDASFLSHYLHAMTLPAEDTKGRLEHFGRAVELNPRFAAALHGLSGAIVATDGDLAHALELSKTAVDADPSRIGFQVRYALILQRLGRAEEARKALDDATRRFSHFDPDGISLYGLCVTATLGGVPDAALPACNRAIEKKPKSPEFHDARGLARALTGDLHGASEDFHVVIKRSKEKELVAQRKEWVKELDAGRNPTTNVEFPPPPLEEWF